MSRKTLRVLCLGDSLTSGYPVGQPYGYKLQDELESAFLGHGYGEVEVVNDGDPGELVTKGTFKERMEEQCKLSHLLICLCSLLETMRYCTGWNYTPDLSYRYHACLWTPLRSPR